MKFHWCYLKQPDWFFYHIKRYKHHFHGGTQTNGINIAAHTKHKKKVFFENSLGTGGVKWSVGKENLGADIIRYSPIYRKTVVSQADIFFHQTHFNAVVPFPLAFFKAFRQCSVSWPSVLTQRSSVQFILLKLLRGRQKVLNNGGYNNGLPSGARCRPAL